MPRKLADLILLVDDHVLVRHGTLTVLQQAMPHLTFLEAGSVHEAMSILREVGTVDLVLLDIQLPGINGLDGLHLLRQINSSVRIAIMSGQSESASAKEALERGADGFISKTACASEFLGAVTRLLSGERHFPTLLSDQLPGFHKQQRNGLTDRQLEILSLMADGSSNKVIARKLLISENTVRVHVSAVLDYFESNNRTSAINTARQQGLLG